MPEDTTGKNERDDERRREEEVCAPSEPSLFHGAEEVDECEADRLSRTSLPFEPPPPGEDLRYEPGHIPSQEEWLGTTSSEEESLEEAEEEAAGEAVRRAPKATRSEEE